MQASFIVLLFLLCVAMFGVKETVSIEEEDTQVEFRTGTPQREPQDKRFLNEPDGHLLISGAEHVDQAKNHRNDMDTAETHHFRRRMRIRSRFAHPPIFGGGFPSFGGGFPSFGGIGGGFPFFAPLLGGIFSGLLG